MNLINIKPKRLLLLLFGVCILSISLVFFALSLNKPYMGIEFSRDEQGWVVTAVDATGLAISHGIHTGDKPMEINGEPAQLFLQQYEGHNAVWGLFVEQLTVINDQGQVTSVTLEGSSRSIESIIELSTWLVVSVAFWITGCFIFFKKPENKAAVLFFLCALIIGLSFSANMATTRSIPTSPYFAVASSLFGPWLLVHFFLILPDEHSSLRNNPRVYLIYLPALITLVLFPLIGYHHGQPVLWFRSLRLFESGAGLIVAAGVVIYNYASSVSIKTKQQTKIILISSMAALLPILVLNVLPQAIWGQEQTILPAGFSVLFIAFIPLGIVYSIASQKLMDIDIIIRRSVIYGLITIVMAAILSVAIFVVDLGDYLEIPQRIIIFVVVGGIAAALFGPIRNGAEILVDKYFYKDRYDYRRIIQDLNTTLNSVQDFSTISRLIVGTSVQTLNLSGGCLFVKNLNGSFETGAVQGTFLDLANQEKLLALISQRNNDIEFPNPAPGIGLDLGFLIPLISGGREIGILCLTEKKSKQQFSSNDLFLLQGMASVATMSLRSAMLIRDVNMRDTFVSIASHELRTPLTSILGYTDLLLHRDPPEATRKKWLEYVFDSGNKISDMVDDLLNVSRIQSGRIAMKLEHVKLSKIFEEQLVIAQEITGKHEFTVDTEPNLPDVLVDPDKFGGVIGNLLNNAVKYSPKGGRIILSAHHELQQHRVVLSITDEGIGISPTDRDLLFTTFHRIQRPETQGVRGSGLGLYITKEWTKAMGGDIWVESELDKGSTFFVAVPINSYKGETSEYSGLLEGDYGK